MSAPPFLRATAAAAALVLTATVATDSRAASPDSAGSANEGHSRTVIDYQGSLQDGQGRPISGVFHLSFKFYAGVQSDRPQWTSDRWVAVTDGQYMVPLGEKTRLRSTTLEHTRWLGVELVGGPELLRDKLEMARGRTTRRRPPAPTADRDRGGSKKTKKLVEKAKNSKKIAFADVAERAVEADRAEVAETARSLGSMSAKKVKKLSNLALERLGEHVADPNAHNAAGGPQLGDRSRVMKKFGGSGGGSFRSSCPEGYVMTGLRGRSGHVVDAIQIVCRKLE
ncbi:MAG: hypothetical protein ABEL76_06205 [Bradymonadaceae bacterium]